MYVAFLATGLMLKVIGGLDIEEIDRSWMLNQKAEGGPFGSMDHVGFNVIVDVFDSQNDPADQTREYKAAVVEFFRPYLQRGDLGQKTGKGFYSYPDPDFLKPEFLDGKTENPLAGKALINSVLATALTLVIEGAGDIRDVDRSWMITHRPDIGPFGMIDEKGLDVFLAELEERAALDPLFAVNFPVLSGYLKGYIEKGELGMKTGKGFYSYPDPEFKNPDFLLNAE
jgi:3-hydroxyacyl-CoA dehydrogenase